MTTAAANLYQHRAASAPFSAGSKLKKAQKSSRFRTRNTYGVGIKDRVLIDPACGSGNFLTETFLELRRLENRVLEHLLHSQGVIDFGADTDAGSLVKVSINQMHGIEINDFAVSVAKTALWIAQQQALDATESIAGQSLPHLPLHDSGSIVQKNALRYDWNQLLLGTQCDYVMGNPPFIGHISRTYNTADDMKLVWENDYDGYLDYATGWHRKASRYLAHTPSASFAFVSTNSVVQGQPVASLFKPLYGEGWRIKFAHQTFAWNAQSSDIAHVHVVIIGMDMSSDSLKPPVLYTYLDIKGDPTKTIVKHINAYLLNAPDIFINKRSQKAGTVSTDLTVTNSGSMPADGGNLLISSSDDYQTAMNDPIANKYVCRFVMGKELINRINRWCLWLVDAPMDDIQKSPFLRQRVEACRDYREHAPIKGDAYKLRFTPQLFRDNHQPTVPYVGIPKVFSESRRWATCARLTPDVIAGDMVYTCDDPDGFVFAIIESSMFITWQKTIGGRLESRIRFSNTVVWNNLPLPQVEDSLRQQIIEAGKNIEEMRAHYPNESLASLYSPLGMHPDLIKAHEALDRLVDRAFGAKKPCHTEEERLTILFARYAELTKQKTTKHQNRA